MAYPRLDEGNGNLSNLLDFLQELTQQEKDALFQQVGINKDSELLNLLNVHLGPVTDSMTKRLSQYSEYHIYTTLMLYLPPIILVLGSFGNIFSFIILRQKAMAKISAYFYLSALAVADFLVLYFGLLRLWVGELTGFDIRDRATWLCKAFMILGYVSSDVSVWLIVVVTIERFIVVCFPFRATRLCTTLKARKITLCLIIIFVLIHVHFLWTVQVREDLPTDSGKVEPRCSGGERYITLVTVIWPWIDAALYFIIPFVVITILNILIIRQVCLATRKRGSLQYKNDKSSSVILLTGGSPSSGAQVRKETSKSAAHDSKTKLTMMLLTISFVFLITTLPINTCMILARFWNEHSTDLSQMTRFHLANTVAKLLMFCNHSINFFLYCAMGQKFRRQLVRLVCVRLFQASYIDHSKHIYCSRQCNSYLVNLVAVKSSDDSDNHSPMHNNSKV